MLTNPVVRQSVSWSDDYADDLHGLTPMFWAGRQKFFLDFPPIANSLGSELCVLAKEGRSRTKFFSLLRLL